MLQTTSKDAMSTGHHFSSYSSIAPSSPSPPVDGSKVPKSLGGVGTKNSFEITAGTNTPLRQNNNDNNNRRGLWKDGLFDCFRYGYFHPTVWNAMCCPQILMAQIGTRLKLNWKGDAHTRNWRKSFRIVLCIVVTYWTICSFVAPAPTKIIAIHHETGKIKIISPPNRSNNDDDDEEPLWQQRLYDLLTVTFGIYTICFLTKIRWIVRQRNHIPIQYTFLGQWEDFCCSFWCGCCAVAQIARHTTTYDTRKASCCSQNGLQNQEEDEMEV